MGVRGPASTMAVEERWRERGSKRVIEAVLVVLSGSICFTLVPCLDIIFLRISLKLIFSFSSSSLDVDTVLGHRLSNFQLNALCLYV